MFTIIRILWSMFQVYRYEKQNTLANGKNDICWDEYEIEKLELDPELVEQDKKQIEADNKAKLAIKVLSMINWNDEKQVNTICDAIRP